MSLLTQKVFAWSRLGVA